MLLEIVSKNQIVDGILLPFFPEAMEMNKKVDPSFDRILSQLNDAYTDFLISETLEDRFEAFVTYGFSYLQGLVYLVHYPDDDKLELMEVRATYFTDLFIMFTKFIGRRLNEQQVGLIGSVISMALEQFAISKLSKSTDVIEYNNILSNLFAKLESV
jgi:hypothetical protein